MAVDIPVRQKYRHPGSWPKTQKSAGGGNGTRRKIRNKLPKTGKQGIEYQEQHARSMAGMRTLVVEPGGRRRWQ